MSATELNDDVSSPSSPMTAGGKFAGYYLLIRQLTSGIWLARDEVRDEEVTLHFIPAVKDDRALKELRLDVRKNRQLIHPNILRVHDLAEENEWMAVAVEAFEGESLASQIDRQQGKGGDLSTIQSWAEQVSHTLEEAHRINVLHRDLTPENIFLTAEGKALVANFGISRTLRDARERAGEPQPTGFTSPQMREGKAATRADDIYSFGATLFAAAVGQAPSVGDNTSSQTGTGLSTESLAALERANLPANWRTTILACLDGDPEARPRSAADLGRRLGELSGAAASPPEEEPAAVPAPVEAPQAPIETALEFKIAPAPATGPEAVTPAPEPEAVNVPDLAPPEPESPAPAIAVVKLVTPVEEWAKPDVGPMKSAESATSRRREPDAEVKEPVRSATEAPAASKTPQTPAPERKREEPKAAPAPAPRLEERATTSKPADPTSGKRREAPRFPVPVLAGAALLLVVVAIILLTHRGNPSVVVDTNPSQGGAVTPVPAAPAPVSVPAPVPAPASPSQAVAALTDKEAALTKARQDADAAEKAQSDLRKQQQAMEEDLAKTETGLEEKCASLKTMQKAAEELEAQRKKLEETRNTAEQTANELKKQAAEKARLFEESATALKQFEDVNAKSLAAPQRAEEELSSLKKEADEKRRAVADGATAVAAGDAALKSRQSAIADQEHEVQKLKTQATAAVGPTPSPRTPAPEPLVVMATTPAPRVPPANPEAPAPGGGNSLGMRFVPVGDVEFCIWLTRLQDFEIFAKTANIRSRGWKSPGFKQGPDHPVVNVSWDDAMAFCQWLTDKEHKEKTLPANQFYRLPTDLEWSKAVGLPEEKGSTPEKRDMEVADIYPWGTQWPPPRGAGNYTGEETGPDSSIKGYDDGFSWTSPVGSFAVNKYGLYDMGGNAWQWCMDTWNGTSKNRVLRGASWYNGGLRLSLLSSCRVNAAPDTSTDNYGFRVVRAKDGARSGKK